MDLRLRYVPYTSIDSFHASDAPVDLVTPRYLTSTEEANLFRRLNFLKYRAEVLRSMLLVDWPSEPLMDEIENLLDEAQRVQGFLISTFMNLAVSAARKFVRQDQPLDDLLGEANATLVIAVERFDVDRGFRFSTYLTSSIHHNLCRLLNNQRKQRTLVASSEQLDHLPDNRRGSWSYHRRLASTIDGIYRLIDDLPSRERQIVFSRFGLGSEPRRLTLQEIADRFGVSRERIRQLEQRALAKLRLQAEQQRLELPV